MNKNNIFYKIAILIGKILIAYILLIFTYEIFVAKDDYEFYISVFFFVFLTLPTIFLVYFKNKFLAKYPGFTTTWKIVRVIYVSALILFVLLAAVGYYRLLERNKVQTAVAFINSQKITLNDVMGRNLPPVPDQELNNSTIAGIDANNNYIRDDVELAIFEKYPDSAKIRAAELQYAQALQLELTQVFNSETLVAAMQKVIRASNCVDNDDMAGEVMNLLIDRPARQQQLDSLNNKYMTNEIYQEIVTDSASSINQNDQICDTKSPL